VTTGPVGVGIIGAGMISDFYLENLTRFPDTNVLAIADIDLDRAKAAAEKWNVPSAGAAEDLLADPDIEIVLNLRPASMSGAKSRSRSTANPRRHWWTSPVSVTYFSESLQILC
jgi:Oxidoreductase family, NAD-binding Rossmann fold